MRLYVFERTFCELISLKRLNYCQLKIQFYFYNVFHLCADLTKMFLVQIRSYFARWWKERSQQIPKFVKTAVYEQQGINPRPSDCNLTVQHETCETMRNK